MSSGRTATKYHNALLEDLLVIRLAVDCAQVCQKMTRIHAIQAMKQTVHSDLQVHQVHIRYVH